MNHFHEHSHEWRELERVENRYNAEHDLPSDPCPDVSFTEMTLMNALQRLSREVIELRGKIALLEENSD